MTSTVELKAIDKSYGGLKALNGVDFHIEGGEIHALLGENGAGKSTLMRVLGGETIPDAGSIVLGGRLVSFRDPRSAREEGIALIHQELALAPDLTVAENIFLGDLPGFISWKKLNEKAGDLINRLGFDINPSVVTGSLAVAHQQIVEIAKALSQNTKIIVFDEPTAVLATKDALRLHGIIRELRKNGVGIVYISHRLEEVFEIADRMTVMKDGSIVGTVTPQNATMDDVIKMMVGRPLAALFPPKANANSGTELLRVENLTAGRRVRDVSFHVNAGEIVGLGGLVGSGRTEVARAIFGADRFDSGKVKLRGKALRIQSPRDAVKVGIGLVPEDRKTQGVALDKPIKVNATMAAMSSVVNPIGFLRLRLEKRLVTDLGKTLRLKAASVEAPVSSLSGGNQQKVVLAKWFHADGDVIILDEPTRGVDVGAKAEIYGLVNDLAKKGKAVLVISSEHQELFGLCDRVLVMSEGQLKGELFPAQYTEEKLLTLAMAGPIKTTQGKSKA